MIWIASVFTITTIAYWIVVKSKRKVRDWIVEISFLGISLVFSALVSFNIWPTIDPLWALKAVFMPITEWLYQAV